MLFDTEDCRMPESRSRMISFRVTSEEFERFRRLCLDKGLRNVSEVVRLAVNQLLSDDLISLTPEPMAIRVGNLESRVATLESHFSPDQSESEPARAHANGI